MDQHAKRVNELSFVDLLNHQTSSMTNKALWDLFLILFLKSLVGASIAVIDERRTSLVSSEMTRLASVKPVV